VVTVIGRLVELGNQVATEVVLVLEAPFAVGAVGVYVAIVFLELCVAVEILLIRPLNAFPTFRLSGGGETKSATDLFAWPTDMVVLLCVPVIP